ncbi:S8 family serine peptidase [Halorarum halophilum]|uniref:S8 family serine peptidase n=1 Tax=Halorarum halophilum TaxID=2743090 RepID=A0A7D5GB44_9EURY|nr:S8 family serine peptidase [Halobaculum halophilum]QLG27092.1 S8 family serine peptidase [Halobaculum halophilum]
MAEHSRRRFLTVAGSALAGATLASGSAAGESGESTRFVIDLREVDRADVPGDVEIIHDLSRIDLLGARGDPDSVPGTASTTVDIEMHRHETTGSAHHADGSVGAEGDDGPVAEEDEDEEDETATPSRRDLQWDKAVHELEADVHEYTRGAGSRVAVIDSGVYDGHPDLADVVNGELSRNFTTDSDDFRPNGAGDHGTHVAGIVAATNAAGGTSEGRDGDDEPTGVLGTAPETDLLSLRVFSDTGGATFTDTVAAILYAADVGCDAANLSLGYPVPYIDPEEYPELLTIAEYYERGVAYARERGTVVVNSTGNDSLDMSPEDVLSLPTEVDGMFGVSATGPIGYLWDDDIDDDIEAEEALEDLRRPTSYPASYTNYGTGTDVSAAGGNYDPRFPENYFYDLVFSTIVEDDGADPSPGYGWKGGTSMAAPQVAGAVALVRSMYPEASADEVEALVRETADDLGETLHGSGHLDLEALVEATEEAADEFEDEEEAE